MDFALSRPILYLVKCREITSGIMDIGPEEQAPVGLTFVAFDPSDPTASHRASARSSKPKQRLVTEEEKANIRAVRAKGPCMRCKILKKQV
jgi:hypothetical protein